MLWREEKRFRSLITHGLASKFWVLRERRKYIRFDDELKIRYNPVRNSHNFHYSKTSNVSKKGLCLLTYEKLKEKDFIDLEIEIPGFLKPIKVVGEVMWIKDLHNKDTEGRRLFYTGLRFYKIRPEAEAVLLTHLNTLKQALM
jgi:hypothetical protein